MFQATLKVFFEIAIDNEDIARISSLFSIAMTVDKFNVH